MDAKFYNILGKVLQRTGNISKDLSIAEAAAEAMFAAPNVVFARQPGELMTNFDRAVAGTVAQEAHDTNPEVIAKAKAKAAGKKEHAENDSRRYKKQIAAIDAKADEPNLLEMDETGVQSEPNVQDFNQALINDEIDNDSNDMSDRDVEILKMLEELGI